MITLTNYKFLTIVKIEGLERLGKMENALMIYSGEGGGKVTIYWIDSVAKAVAKAQTIQTRE